VKIAAFYLIAFPVLCVHQSLHHENQVHVFQFLRRLWDFEMENFTHIDFTFRAVNLGFKAVELFLLTEITAYFIENLSLVIS
jgi:hypothetical protein